MQEQLSGKSGRNKEGFALERPGMPATLRRYMIRRRFKFVNAGKHRSRASPTYIYPLSTRKRRKFLKILAGQPEKGEVDLTFGFNSLAYSQGHDRFNAQEKISGILSPRLLPRVPGDGCLHCCPMVFVRGENCPLVAVGPVQELRDSVMVSSNASAVQPRAGPAARNSPHSGGLSSRYRASPCSGRSDITSQLRIPPLSSR
jgi:hypothetical protein